MKFSCWICLIFELKKAIFLPAHFYGSFPKEIYFTRMLENVKLKSFPPKIYPSYCTSWIETFHYIFRVRGIKTKIRKKTVLWLFRLFLCLGTIAQGTTQKKWAGCPFHTINRCFEPFFPLSLWINSKKRKEFIQLNLATKAGRFITCNNKYSK